MTTRSITHATFTLERTYNASPARVFAAFAQPELKRRWFGGPPEWESGAFELDFRVGGQEIERGGPVGGPTHTYEARYQDIVAGERIVYTYAMYLDDARISVSLASIELAPVGAGTRLTLTEHGAYFDGQDAPALREHGTGELLDALGAFLASTDG